MSMSIKASPDGTYGELLVNGAVVAKLPVTGNAVIPGLVGTVSQSGGVPTGAIIERGSNANGDYVRFADGTQICWHAFAGGSNWTYPAAFFGDARPLLTSFAALPRIVTTNSNTATSTGTGQWDISGAAQTSAVRGAAFGRWF